MNRPTLKKSYAPRSSQESSRQKGGLQKLCRKIFLAIFCLCMAFGQLPEISVHSAGNIAQIRVLVTADEEGALLPSECKNTNGAIGVIQQWVNQENCPSENCLVISTGDIFTSDPIGSLFGGETVIDTMNKMGYDVLVLDNHELDYGVAQTKKLRDMAHFDFVSANYVAQDNNLAFSIPATVKERDGVRIGIIGFSSQPWVLNNKSRQEIDETLANDFDRALENGLNYIAQLGGADIYLFIRHNDINIEKIKNRVGEGKYYIINIHGENHWGRYHRIDLEIDKDTKQITNNPPDAAAYIENDYSFDISTAEAIQKVLQTAYPDPRVSAVANSIKNAYARLRDEDKRYAREVLGNNQFADGKAVFNFSRNVPEAEFANLLAQAWYEKYPQSDVSIAASFRVCLSRGPVYISDLRGGMPFRDKLVTFDFGKDALIEKVKQNSENLSFRGVKKKGADIAFINRQNISEAWDNSRKYHIVTNDYLASNTYGLPQTAYTELAQDWQKPTIEWFIENKGRISAQLFDQAKTKEKVFQQRNMDGFGIGSGIHLRVGEAGLKTAIDELNSLGIHWLREEIPWQEVEPQPDNFRWEYDFGSKKRNFPLLFAELKKNRISPIVILDYGSCYLSRPVRDDELVARWENYVQKVVDKFGSQVDYWEIGNEMNSPDFWGKVVFPTCSAGESSHPMTPNPELYARLLSAAHQIIKESDPNDVVILGGLVRVAENDCSTNPFSYLNRLYAAGVWNQFDIIAYHPYWNSNPPEAFISRGWAHAPATGVCRPGKTAQYNLIGEVRALRDLAAEFGAKPIWITEVGWDQSWLETIASYRGAAPNLIEADFLVRTYVPLLAEAGVEEVFWYTLYEDDSGIHFQLDAPGKQALKNLSALLTHSKRLGQIQGQNDQGGTQDDDVNEYRFEKDGQLIIIAWKARGGDVKRYVDLTKLDVEKLWLYPIGATDLSPEAGKEFVVTDQKVNIYLTEQPVFLVSQKLNWWENLIHTLQQTLEEWQENLQKSFDEWTQQQQKNFDDWQAGMKDKFDEWVKQQQKKFDEWLQARLDEVEKQIADWWAEVQRQIEQMVMREIERMLSQLCGCQSAMILPAGIALLWFRNRKRC